MCIKKSSGIILSIFLILFFALKAIAAPSINSTDGIFSNGQTVTINGIGFGTKPNAAPLKFDLFEEGSHGERLDAKNPSWKVYECAYGSAPNPRCDRQGALYSSEYPHSGNLSIGRNIVDYSNFNTNYYTHPTPTEEMFVSYWWRTANADSGDNSIIKMTRMNSSISAGGGGVYHGDGGTAMGGTYNLASGGGPYAAFNNGATGESFYNSSEGSVARMVAPPKNKWVRVDMYKKLSTPGNTDGVIKADMLGVDAASNMSAMTRAAGKSFLMDTIFLGLTDGKDTTHNYDMYIDDMYIDNTQARVEVCNTASWSSRTNCDIQPAKAWSTSSISITINQGALPSMTGQYLYVVDHNGLVNTSGYLINEDGSVTLPPGVPSAPSAPSGLRLMVLSK